MISEKLQNAINEQITAEMWSSNLYLSMSFYFACEGFDGFAHWMKKQSQGWGSPLEVFQHVYEHECKVSKMIDNLVSIASAEKDNATQDFLWGFVREQVEEEATAQGIVDKLKKAGDTGLLFIDAQLAKR